uniref:Type-b response regulator n=1 Tax=Solanum tuberosum TaxID=4113 RepID=M1DBH0_SOLTU
MIDEVSVLLIDDDKKFVSEMIYLLESHEYKVRTVDMASQGMSMLSKGKEKIDLMIINMNSAGLLSFQLLDQAVALDIVSVCICDEYDVRSAKKAFESGAYFYMQKQLYQGFVKYMWQLVLQKNIQEGKTIDVIDIVGDNVEENNVPINIDEQGNDIHETTNDVVSNEKSKLRKKKGRKLTEEEKSQSSATKVIIRRKTRIIWTADLHDKFQQAVNKLNDGRCFPSDILEAMNVPGLTRYQVASHLQKCRNNTWKAPRKRKSSCRQLGISSSLGIFETTTSHVKMNVTNLQQQETQRSPATPFLPDNNNIFARGAESSTLQEVYVDPQYLNPLLSNNVAEEGPLWGSNIGLEFNNGIHHAQNDYALDVATAPADTNISNATIDGLGVANNDFQQHIGELQGSNIGSADYTPGLEFNINGIHHTQNDYALDTNISNATIDGLGVQQQNMAQHIVTTSHVSDTQGSEMMDCDAYFDFDKLDFFYQNNELPSFDLPNEHDSLFDQVYSDDMVSTASI